MADKELSLLEHPHHDGSDLYVLKTPRDVGDTAIVRLRVPDAAGVTEVLVRVVEDGEHRFVPAMREKNGASGAPNAETWWVAELPTYNPVLNYRFLLDGGPTGVRWLNAAGLWDRDVPDDADFKLTVFQAPPEWAKDAIVYQVFPDRFATTGKYSQNPPPWAEPSAWEDPVNGTRAHAGRQFYGGDLDGITERLDHLVDMGVNVLYLTPVFPAGSTHRYDATTFDDVDPLLGGAEAFENLLKSAHSRGIRVMGDLTANHTGIGHDWFIRARANRQSPEHGFYLWHSNGEPVGWLGSKTLVKLNYDNQELRQRMFHAPNSPVKRWLRAGLDGWRIDVANMTGRYGHQELNHQVAKMIRQAATDEQPSALVVAEHVHDYTGDLPGDGWHGVMNYSGFSKPVWTWLLSPHADAEFLGTSVVVPRLGGSLVVETMRDFTSRVPWENLVASFNLIDSHDTSRALTMFGGDRGVLEAAVGLLMTMPSIPMVLYGDEIGMEGKSGEDGRKPMRWNRETWDSEAHAIYRDLIALRRDNWSLRHGGLRWIYIDDDALVFLRETETQTALVHVARAAHRDVELSLSLLAGAEEARVAYGHSGHIHNGDLVLSAASPGISVLIW